MPGPILTERRCRAYACTCLVAPDRWFCARHWGLLVRAERAVLGEAYGTERWRDELRRAQRIILAHDPAARALLGDKFRKKE